MRVRFKVGFLVVSLAISLVPSVMAMEENIPNQSHPAKPAQALKRKRVISKEDSSASKGRSSKKIKTGNKGTHQSETAKEATEDNETVSTLTLVDLAEEVLLPIFNFAISSNTIIASKTMLSLKRVSWLTNRLITDPPFLKRQVTKIPGINLEKCEEMDRKDFAFSIVYVSKRITGLELQGRYEEAQKVYFSALLNKNSPLPNSRLLAYRAALFLSQHETPVAEDTDKKRLEEKAIVAAYSFLGSQVDDKVRGYPFNFHKDEALLQLFYIFRINPKFASAMESVTERINEVIKALIDNNLEKNDFPAYLLRLIALREYGVWSTGKIKLLEEAAHRGDGSAQYELSQHYIKSDLSEGMKWLEKAAEQGHLEATFDLGTRYMMGLSVSKDWEQAIKWLTQSANKGHTESLHNLGVCYENRDEEGLRNLSKAEYLYTQAAEQGCEEAMIALNSRFWGAYVLPSEREAIFKRFRSNANQGDVESQYMLGTCYAEGNGVRQNWRQAAYWYDWAARKGHKLAQRELGLCYEEGQGVPKDKEKAITWIRISNLK
jgi:TPR repeat protein